MYSPTVTLHWQAVRRQGGGGSSPYSTFLHGCPEPVPRCRMPSLPYKCSLSPRSHGAMNKIPLLPLGEKFEEALLYACRHHREQPRKGTAVPYVSHLLQVAGLVLEAGGDEELAIAGLLHDAIEDAPAGDADRVRGEISDRFGSRVLAVVEGLTDADTHPKPPWEERKRAYLHHLASQGSAEVLLVSSADKLHNVRAILRDFRRNGDALWDRFAGKRDGTLWYYRALADAYTAAGGTPLSSEVGFAVAELEAAVGAARR
jgi:(p)ppGpp synthase/HD superfamily hydrolase